MKRQKSKAGFTLVELIIVIAILGILAGIAIPVYSGYITKAHKAADLELLGAVNTSFASACAEIGLGSTDVTDATLVVKDKCITGVRVTGLSRTAPLSVGADKSGVVMANLSANPVLLDSESDSERIAKAFSRYFGANIGTELKYFGGAGNFAFKDGVFVAYDNGEKRTFVYEGKDGQVYSVSISPDELNQFAQSTFGTSSEITTDKLMDSVNDVVSATAGLITDKTIDTLKNNEYLLDKNGGLEGYLTSLGMDQEAIDAVYKDPDKLANAFVLYAAAGAKGMDAKELVSAIQKNGTIDVTDGGNMITASTIPYAMAMAYAYSNKDAVLTELVWEDDVESDDLADWLADYYDVSSLDEFRNTYIDSEGQLIESYDEATKTYHFKEVKPGNESVYEYFTGASLTNLNDLDAIITRVGGDAGYQAYLQSEQAVTDAQGFLSAMDMISANTSNIGTDELLANGFASDDLKGIVSSIFGG